MSFVKLYNRTPNYRTKQLLLVIVGGASNLEVFFLVETKNCETEDITYKYDIPQWRWLVLFVEMRQGRGRVKKTNLQGAVLNI